MWNHILKDPFQLTALSAVVALYLLGIGVYAKEIIQKIKRKYGK